MKVQIKVLKKDYKYFCYLYKSDFIIKPDRKLHIILDDNVKVGTEYITILLNHEAFTNLCDWLDDNF
jgi:hypothetical protein